MPILVQKFGGTSVADTDKIVSAARKAIAAHQAGNQVVVVVSAMGKSTDELVSLAKQISNGDPLPREMDMLLATGEQKSVALMAMAIHALGYNAIGMTGFQLGIKTDSKHTVARIQSINVERVLRELEAGKIVIAAGFQGIDPDRNITTLGRGGSDTTAVALAAQLKAPCEIYTDVDGVYTIDPRLVPTARKLERISYDEMLELASLGAGVMHSRSIEFAKKFHVPIHVRSSFNNVEGTHIGRLPESTEQPICGTAIVRDEARVTIMGVPDAPGTALEIFSAITRHNISVDMVIQNEGDQGKTDMSFTVLQDDLNKTLKIAQELTDKLAAERVTFDDAVSKVSVVGVGMETQPGVASRAFAALAEAGININMITTSVIKISMLVERGQARAALWALHQAFQLDKPPRRRPPLSPDQAGGEAAPQSAAEFRHELELAINEDVSIEKISRDDQQALVTISGVPDRPGLAAAVFAAIAQEEILVDMIVQDAGVGGAATLSFTVPRSEMPRARQLASQLSQKLGLGAVSASDEIDILSVSGVGLGSHTAVLLPMFRALAGDVPSQDGINVRLINTSEVCVSVIVDAVNGEEAERRIRAVFSAATDA